VRARLLRPALVAAAVGGLVVGAFAVPAAAAVPTTPFVAELHYDNTGADAGEFVEVQLPAGTTVTGWSVVLYNGNDGAAYATIPLPPTTAPASGPVAVAVDTPGIQNGAPDGVALVDAAGAVAEFLSYEGVLTATGGPAAGRTSTDIGVAETGSGAVGTSLSRVVSGGDLVWRGPATATPGTVNPGAAPPPPPATCSTAPTQRVGDVQGAGASTPLAGQQVSVRGTVVAATPGLGGFNVEDAGDGNTATSDGVFVYSPGTAVRLGQTVQVSGQAQEFSGQTQIAARSGVAVCDVPVGPLPAPAPLDLPADDAAREPLEGMLVRPVDQLTVSEVYNLTSFGELVLSEGGVLVQPTELARPSPDADAIAAANTRRRIVLDDASTSRLSVTTAPYLTPANPVRVGDPVQFTEPTVLGFGFGAWRLEPADGTADGVFAAQNTRPAAPDPVGGDVRVGSFNVLNYFLTFGGVGRGADDQAGLDRQAAKIVSAIRGLDADVLTLEEIEDTASTGYGDGSPDQAVADLVRRLNTAAGYAEWAYSPFPTELLGVDRDVIRNAIIYRTARVQPVGAPVGLVDEAAFGNAREPIAQTFAYQGDEFTVIGNHFKSKGGSGATGDNADTGQGAFNGDRTRQAQALAGFVQRLQTESGDPDVFVLGDLNAYTREDPVEVLRSAGLTDLGTRFDAGRYSYVFNALSGSLDHAMTTPTLTAKVTGAVHWTINAQESFAYEYDGNPALYAPNAYRASDHNPIVSGLDLTDPRDQLCDGRVPTIIGTDGNDVLRGTDGPDVILGLGGNDRISGGNGDDVICAGPGNDAVDAGNGNDRVDGGSGDDTILGGNGDDLIRGGTGADQISGDNGNDQATGGRGNDTVIGGNGDDRLAGGSGTDVLDGGNGRNVVVQDGPDS